MEVINLPLLDGHLCRRVAAVLKQAGYVLPDYGPDKRIYEPSINAEHFRILVRRPMQIAIELARGEADVGITGLDCTREFPGAELLLDLEKPVTKLVLAVPNSDEFNHITSFEAFVEHIFPKGVTIYSEYPRFVRQYFANHPAYRLKCTEPPGLDLGWQIIRSSSPIGIRLSFGSTEGNKFFVDIIETGGTLKANGSKPICTLLERSTPWLAASQRALSDPWKRAKIIDLQSRLKAAIEMSSRNV